MYLALLRQYFDLFGYSWYKDHTRYIRAVFKPLSKSKFNLKYKKCALFLLEVEFLEHMESWHGV